RRLTAHLIRRPLEPVGRGLRPQRAKLPLREFDCELRSFKTAPLKLRKPAIVVGRSRGIKRPKIQDFVGKLDRWLLRNASGPRKSRGEVLPPQRILSQRAEGNQAKSRVRRQRLELQPGGIASLVGSTLN